MSENPVLRAGPRLPAAARPGAAPRHVPQALPPRADAGVLLVVPQGPPRRAGQRLPLVPRLQRLRQLAGLGRVGRGRALVLLPAEAAEVRRLPHAARGRRTIPRRRTARCTRIASPPPTPRCRSSTRTTSSSQVTQDVPEGRRGHGRRLRPGAGRGAGAAVEARAGGGRRAAAREHLRGRARSRRASAPRRRSCATPAPRSWRRSTRCTPARAARRVGARRRRGADAQGRPLLPGRHGRRLRRLGRARGRRRRTAGRSSTAARSRTSGKGPVEPGAHFYRSLQLDEHGNPINKRNAWTTRSVAYVRLIPPGAADTVHYRLRDPRGLRRHDHAHARRSTTASSPGGTRSGPSPACATREHKDFALAPGPRRRPLGLHRRHLDGVGQDQGASPTSRSR